VFQACFWAIKSCALVADCTTPLERLALLTAALGCASTVGLLN
jgi:hypothetical protein